MAPELHRSQQVRPEILEEAMKIYRNSLSQNLPEAYANRVLAMFDQVIAQLQNKPVNLRSS
jgi:hypothetical protein